MFLGKWFSKFKVISFLFLLSSFSLPSAAAVINVNKTADTNDAMPGDNVCDDGSGGANRCSLRAAIEEANARPGSDNIYLQAGATYNLTQGTLDIKSNLKLIGKENSPAIIRPHDDASGPARSQLLKVWEGTDITLQDLVVRDGDGGNAFSRGVGIFNSGRIFALRVRVHNNTGRRTPGVGIHNAGEIIFKDGDISNNTNSHGESSAGGGVYNRGIMTIEDSSIIGNTATFGAGIYTISATNKLSSDGTLEYYHDHNTRLTLKNVTLANNVAQDGGGGVFSVLSTMSIENSTIFENSVTRGTGGTEKSGGGGFAYGFYPRDGLVPGNISNGGAEWVKQQCYICHTNHGNGYFERLVPARYYHEYQLAQKIHATMGDDCEDQCAVDVAAWLKANPTGAAPYFVHYLYHNIENSIIAKNIAGSSDGNNCKIVGEYGSYGSGNVWGYASDYDRECADRTINAGNQMSYLDTYYTNFTLHNVGHSRIGRRVGIPSGGQHWAACSNTNPPSYCDAGATLPPEPEPELPNCSNKPAWKKKSAYNAGAEVKHNGKLYRATQRIPKKKAAPNNNASWQYLGDCAADGGSGGGGGGSACDNVKSWNKKKAYKVNNEVKYNSELYRATKKIPKKKAPPASNSDWVYVEPC